MLIILLLPRCLGGFFSHNIWFKWLFNDNLIFSSTDCFPLWLMRMMLDNPNMTNKDSISGVGGGAGSAGSAGFGEIPAIFNPKRVRTPSVVVTGDNDSPNGPGPFGIFSGGTALVTNAAITGPATAIPQITHSDSLSSSQHEGGVVDSLTGIGGCEITMPPINDSIPTTTQTSTGKFKKCRESCCSELAKKVIEQLSF